jgi:hypothetical protein
MGLDTYASRAPDQATLSDEDERAFEEAGLELCGGMYSGDGGSFRGKVYSEAVEHVTGVSLYELWIPPERVREMAAAFERSDPEQVEAELAGEYGETTASEIRELARFLHICSDRGLGLVGWV